MPKKKTGHEVPNSFFKGLSDHYHLDHARQHHVIRTALWILVIFILCLLVWKLILLSIHKQHAHKLTVPVVVAQVKKGDMPVYITALGSVTPTDNITVKTQINGLLMRFAVEEGQTVKEGQLLAKIDSRIYEAQLLQYEGQLIRDCALLANAKLDLERYTILLAENAVSKQVYDTQVSLVRQYEGNVTTDKGLIQTAKVNIAYCHITSPITGRVGLRLVDPGNFVQTTDTTGIIVINALSPITVVFTVPEDNIQEILERMAANKPLQIEAYDRWQKTQLAVSKTVVIDNLIDTSTGTLKLKAQYENKDGKLFPNQFVNIQLLLKILKEAIIVPTAAVQHGAQGPFLFVLAKDQTVHVKTVKVITTHKDESAVACKICAGDFVVVEGVDKLSDGMTVKVMSKLSDQDKTEDDRKIR
jgi:multidrug efflux system membrane fusion protein